MDRSRVIAGYRVAFACPDPRRDRLPGVDLLDAGRLDLGNFLSYFTIQSNLLAAAVFLLGAARARAGTLPSRTWDLVRGGAVVYMTVTFVVVILLLSGVEVDTQVVWVDIVVHKLFPIVVFADWLIDPPRHRLTVRDSLVWLVFPLGWLAYTMIRERSCCGIPTRSSTRRMVATAPSSSTSSGSWSSGSCSVQRSARSAPCSAGGGRTSSVQVLQQLRQHERVRGAVVRIAVVEERVDLFGLASDLLHARHPLGSSSPSS